MARSESDIWDVTSEREVVGGSPCPFCGGTELSYIETWSSKSKGKDQLDAARVECLGCFCAGPQNIDGDGDDQHATAVTLWNRRR